MDTTESRRAALSDAVTKAGGQTALAAGITALMPGEKVIRQGHVGNWLHRDKQVTPAAFCLAIEHLTGVEAARLRPDVFGMVDRRKGAAA